MFLISIKYSFKKINVSFQTIHCLILYLDRCLYSSLKKKDQHLFNIIHAYQTLKKYMQCKIKIPFNEKKKSKNLSVKIRIGRKLLRSSNHPKTPIGAIRPHASTTKAGNSESYLHLHNLGIAINIPQRRGRQGGTERTRDP